MKLSELKIKEDTSVKVDQIAEEKPQKSKNRRFIGIAVVFVTSYIAFIAVSYLIRYLTGNSDGPNYVYPLVFSLIFSIYSARK